MFDSVLAVPIHFTIEFLGFLVYGGAAGLVLTRPALVPESLPDRALAAGGFVVLALIEVVHGGAFVSSDAGWVVVTGQTLGFALVLAGISGTIDKRSRDAAAALAPAPLHGALALFPAAAALLTSLSAALAARAGARSLWRLSAATLLLCASEVMTAFTPGSAVVGVGSVQPSLYAAHGVKLAGFGALMWWIWSGVRSSIRTRFVAVFGALLVVVVLFLSSGLTGVISSNIERDRLSRVATQVKNVRRGIEGSGPGSVTTHMQAVTATLADLRPVRSRLASRSGLHDLATRLQAGHLVASAFLIFMSPGGRLLAYAGHGPAGVPGRHPSDLGKGLADRLRRSNTIEESSSRHEAAGVVKAGHSITVMSVRAVMAPGGGGLAGVVAAGRWIDAQTITSMGPNTGPERASLLVDKRVVATGLPGHPAHILPAEARRAVRSGHETSVVAQIGHRTYLSAFVALSDAGGHRVATLALSVPASAAASSEDAVTRGLFLATMAVAVMALGLAWLSGRRITRPIQRLTLTAAAVREGNLAAKAQVSGTDEIGQLGETFNEMTSSLVRMTDDLREAVRQEYDLRSRIETIIESMADGLVAVDKDGMVLAFNREMVLLSGTSPDEAIGRPVEDVVGVLDAEGENLQLPLTSTLETSLGGVFLARKEGNPVPVAITTAVLRDGSGKVAGGVAVIRDLTREREVERMKSQFLSNISHELRTPLTPIKGYAQMLGRADIPTEKAGQFAKGIAEYAARLERIVELLVDFAALEGGRLEPKQRAVDIVELVGGLAYEWSKRASAHDVIVFLPNSSPKVVGDARLLRRSIDEVIDNAVKFSPEGGTITVQVRSITTDEGSGMIEIAISDEGIGIEQEDLPRIFTDFQQLDGSATRSYGGLGLGLSFVRRIVEAHYGRVQVESEPGQGTTLTILVPTP